MSSKLVNILLADDDIDDCNFFKTTLSELKLPSHLSIVRDGEQLMEYLAHNVQHLPDILFLDISMPRKSGIECVIEIKENELFRDIPIVIYSTAFFYNKFYEDDLIQRLKIMGADNFVSKRENLPAQKQFIHQAILMALSQTHAR